MWCLNPPRAQAGARHPTPGLRLHGRKAALQAARCRPTLQGGLQSGGARARARASLHQACSRACAGVTRCAGLKRSMSSSRPMAALPRWKLRAALPAGDAALRARSPH